MGDSAGTTTRAPIGAILAIVGGALLAVGSFLPWAEVSGGGTNVSASGIDGSDGYVTLVVGIVALGVGIALTRAAKRALAILAMVAGVIGGGLGLYDALTAQDSVLDSAAEELAPSLGGSVDQVRGLLDEAIDVGVLGISVSIGLYIVIAGGALALVGGVMSLRGERPGTEGQVGPAQPAAPAYPPPAEPPSMPGGPDPSG